MSSASAAPVVPTEVESSPVTPTDGALLKRWCEGDEAAAAELVRRYCTRLRALIASRCSTALAAQMDPDDIAQSVFSLVFQGAKTQGYSVPDHQELWGLLLVLALNKIRNHERDIRCGKRDVHRVHDGDIELDRIASRDDAAPEFLRMLMEDELREWPEQHRHIIQLRLEGYELAAIAQKTQRSTRTVERVLQSFRQKLADVL
jgi:RNA polymerase sigma factor (sigma-70 family)